MGGKQSALEWMLLLKVQPKASTRSTLYKTNYLSKPQEEIGGKLKECSYSKRLVK